MNPICQYLGVVAQNFKNDPFSCFRHNSVKKSVMIAPVIVEIDGTDITNENNDCVINVSENATFHFHLHDSQVKIHLYSRP